jgi:hypothetical protein
MEMARVQTILGPYWNRGFNAQTMLTILTQKSRTHQAFGFGIVSIARVIACRLREMAYGIGPPFRKPAARALGIVFQRLSKARPLDI